MTVVDTRWTNALVTHDDDGVLRVPPTQVRLVVRGRSVEGDGEGDKVRSNKQSDDKPISEPNDGQSRLLAPVAWTWLDPVTGQRLYSPFDSDTRSAFGLQRECDLGWVFVLDQGQFPISILIRRLHLAVSSVKPSGDAVAAALGLSLSQSDNPKHPPTQTSNPTKQLTVRIDSNALSSWTGGNPIQLIDGIDLQMTDALPISFGANQATGMALQDNTVVSGTLRIDDMRALIAQDERISQLYTPGHEVAIRMRLDSYQARASLGLAAVSTAMSEPVWLIDDEGHKWKPIGYVWVRRESGITVAIDRLKLVNQARQIPVTEMKAGDEIYLYFMLKRGLWIHSAHVGRLDFNDLQLVTPH